jgi:3-deoxy-manno-octulosonate cytidylyltransferase (CMP-KDO synthetase)
MIDGKKVVCIIPARLNSSRFPRKILASLSGKPLIQWVWEAAIKISFFDEVVFAIDSYETAQVIENFGGKYHMTSVDCIAATDRLVELQKSGLVKADIWVNWQADEPFVSEKILRDLLFYPRNERADVWTLKTRIYNASQIKDLNCTKVVCDSEGFALYFSRSPIPCHQKLQIPEGKYYKHIGLYAYSEKALEKIDSIESCELEKAESLEQLRFLFHGMKIQVNETKEETIGIDLPEHLAYAEEYLQKNIYSLT